jgi:hypothetical protein
MGAKKHVVDLSDEDRKTLEWFISTGERKSEDNTRARILLKADGGLTDFTISEHVGCHPKTVYNTRKSYVERGSRRFIAASPTASTNANLTGELKLTSSDSLAANHRRDTLAGRSTSLPTNS